MPSPIPEICFIAAVAEDGAVGAGNALLWRIPEDMAFFREQTLGHPVLMGRKTWESLPPKFRPLPGRRNIVVSAQIAYAAAGAEVAASPTQALALAAQPAADGKAVERVFVIGGPLLWQALLPQAQRLLITEVAARYPQADAFFPPIDPALFERQEAKENPLRSAAGLDIAFVQWRRRRPAAKA